MLDEEWIPLAAQLNLVTITRNDKIRFKPGQRDALIEQRSRCVFLVGKGTTRPLQQARALLSHWDQLVAVALESGPRLYTLSWGAPLREVTDTVRRAAGS